MQNHLVGDVSNSSDSRTMSDYVDAPVPALEPELDFYYFHDSEHDFEYDSEHEAVRVDESARVETEAVRDQDPEAEYVHKDLARDPL